MVLVPTVAVAAALTGFRVAAEGGSGWSEAGFALWGALTFAVLSGAAGALPPRFAFETPAGFLLPVTTAGADPFLEPFLLPPATGPAPPALPFFSTAFLLAGCGMHGYGGGRGGREGGEGGREGSGVEFIIKFGPHDFGALQACQVAHLCFLPWG